jgi:hypothetical protein
VVLPSPGSDASTLPGHAALCTSRKGGAPRILRLRKQFSRARLIEVARALCEEAAGEACDPAEPCVPIATVDGRRRGEIHVALYPRRIVAATDVLLELILGLVRRVQVWSSETR